MSALHLTFLVIFIDWQLLKSLNIKCLKIIDAGTDKNLFLISNLSCNGIKSSEELQIK